MYVIVQSLVICYSAEKWAKNKRVGGGATGYWMLREEGESFKKVAEITNAIRSIGFSIDGFEDMEIRVHIKFTFDTL